MKTSLPPSNRDASLKELPPKDVSNNQCVFKKDSSHYSSVLLDKNGGKRRQIVKLIDQYYQKEYAHSKVHQAKKAFHVPENKLPEIISKKAS
mmetsp:Transcript_7242/g.6362  ORF Transcript_7242/g.6362 Transcript_7242/m.6362 type:complete len:92 (+) Transcript_7242:578-853(+)